MPHPNTPDMPKDVVLFEHFDPTEWISDYDEDELEFALVTRQGICTFEELDIWHGIAKELAYAQYLRQQGFTAVELFEAQQRAAKQNAEKQIIK